MAAVATDTHAAAWYITADPRLSAKAIAAFNETTASGYPIIIPSICFVEMTYLVEKRRMVAEIRLRLVALLLDPKSPFEVAPLDIAVAAAAERISREQVPDLPDRVIAATALALNVPLVTKDAMIRASGIPTIW